MHFWIGIFSFTFFLNYITTESVVEFKFNAMSLGHTGLLITWEPLGEETSPYYFTFNTYIAEEENDEDFIIEHYRNLSFPTEDNYCAEQKRKFECHSQWGSFKIHSLNESTLYDVIIKQYTSSLPPIKTYSVKIKTEHQSKRTPAKPDFEVFLSGLFIQWYPCGRKRICNNQESGTHFGVKIKQLYNTRKSSEVETVVFHNDFRVVFFLPGRVYEVVIYSINGDYKTDSDSREIFSSPISSTVQNVKIISLPDLSVLISWKPPKESLEIITHYYWFCIQHFNELYANEENDILFGDNLCAFQDYRNTIISPFEQIRIFNLSQEAVYSYMIIPSANGGLGLDYWLKYKVQVYNDDLPIAKPDFNYELSKNEGDCSFYFQWLPCGPSFHCKDTKPGSEYSFKVQPKPIEESYKKTNGYFHGAFDLNMEYEVTLASFIGNDSSESVTKRFKNCRKIQ